MMMVAEEIVRLVVEQTSPQVLSEAVTFAKASHGSSLLMKNHVESLLSRTVSWQFLCDAFQETIWMLVSSGHASSGVAVRLPSSWAAHRIRPPARPHRWEGSQIIGHADLQHIKNSLKGFGPLPSAICVSGSGWGVDFPVQQHLGSGSC